MQVEPEVLKLLQDWCAGTPSISRAWVFGSRAKNLASADSDLDLAVQLKSVVSGGPISEWIWNAKTWRAQLGELLPEPAVHLEFADPEETAEVVWPAVEGHGVLMFERVS
jgi:predicted nucleotidyltransferase